MSKRSRRRRLNSSIEGAARSPIRGAEVRQIVVDEAAAVSPQHALLMYDRDLLSFTTLLRIVREPSHQTTRTEIMNDEYESPWRIYELNQMRTCDDWARYLIGSYREQDVPEVVVEDKEPVPVATPEPPSATLCKPRPRQICSF